ncbi:MAG: biotin transporter BioY [candidate division WOR-3 bacterium]|jgi:biotin transport system substrate-specific component
MDFISKIHTIEKTTANKVLKILISLIILALTSKIKIFLPFSPVPITGQTFGIFLISLLLGQEAIISVFLFIMLGIFGIPLFATNNTLTIFSPTYGYIIGFFISSFLIVNLKEHFNKKLILLLIFCNFLIYVTGALYLFTFFSFVFHKNLTFMEILYMGVLPFIPGDLLKDFMVVSFLNIQRKVFWRDNAGYKG